VHEWSKGQCRREKGGLRGEREGVLILEQADDGAQKRGNPQYSLKTEWDGRTNLGRAKKKSNRRENHGRKKPEEKQDAP